MRELLVEEVAAQRTGAIKIGPFGSALPRSAMVPDGIKVYGQENLIARDWDVGNRRVTPETFRSLRTCELHPGDVVIGMMGSLGHCEVFSSDAEPGLMDSHLLRIQANQDLLTPEFLRLLVLSDATARQIGRLSHGSIMAGLSSKVVRRVRLFVPPLEEQRRIAEVLDTIDEAIQATERVIAKIAMHRQAVSQAVFGGKSWRSALEVVAVGSLLVRPPRNGKSPHAGESWRGAFMLGLGCLAETGFSPRQLKWAPEMDGSLCQALLADGDLLMSRSNTEDRVGFVGRYRSVGHPCIYPDLMMRLVPRMQVSARFLELALQSGPARRQIRTLASGTSGSMVKITGEAVSKLSVPICPPADQARCCDVFDSLSHRRNVEELRLSKLRHLRAGVAADLLSGRVRTVAA